MELYYNLQKYIETQFLSKSEEMRRMREMKHTGVGFLFFFQPHEGGLEHTL